MYAQKRKATRVALPEVVRASVEGVPVRVLELSTMNARIEHEQPFPLDDPRLRLEWNRSEIVLPFRVMRSEVVGGVHRSGIDFVALDPIAAGLIASILLWAQSR